MDGLSFNLNVMDNEILMNNMSDLTYHPMSPASMTVEPFLETAHGPYLQIIEEPKQRGFRFRYECEGPSHGGLPGASSEKNKKTYPTVRVGNHIGRAKVEVQLVTHTDPPRIHAHSLVGKHCNDGGSCNVIVGPTDLTAQFNNLGILHVTRRGVVDVLTRRLKEERMKQTGGRGHLTESEERAIVKEAKELSVSMDLNVVRLKFTAYLQDSQGEYTLALKPVISNPIYDSKSPNASNLKISRMDKTCGSVLGGDEVFLLCDKVQKDDIEIRFFEDEDGSWEALGDFSPTDVHKQYAIVFKTPQYHTTEIKRPVTVFLQLKRKKGGDCSEPKQFTYVPHNEDKEEVKRKKQKPLPDMYDHWRGPFGDNGGLGGAGGLGGSGGGAGVNGGGGGSCFQFDPAMGGGFGQLGGDGRFGGVGAQMSDSSEPQDAAPGSQPRGQGTPLQQRLLHVAATVQGRTSPMSRQMARALLDYCRTGDVRLLLAVQRHLCAAQDENGDTPLHLAIINQQTSVVEQLVRTIVSMNQQKILDTRNHLQQTPLHLAVITGQSKVTGFLLGAGADPSFLDRDGRTAVHLAAALGDETMLRTVLAPLGERHAHLLNVPDHNGLFPLHLAVRKGAERCLRALVEAGAWINTAELKGGCTALHLAVTENLFRMAFMLITELKADVNAITFAGNTPLHLAASLGSPTLCSMLLAAGAQKNAENDEPLFGLSSDEEHGEAEERVNEGEEGNAHQAKIPRKRPAPGHTPFHLAKCQKVRELLECRKSPMASRHAVSSPKTPTDDVSHLDGEILKQLDGILSRGHVPWRDLAEKLGMLTLADLFQETPSPCQSLLESYQVGGGQVAGLVEALQSLGLNEGVMLLRQTEMKDKTHSADATEDSGFGSQTMDDMERPVLANS